MPSAKTMDYEPCAVETQSEEASVWEGGQWLFYEKDDICTEFQQLNKLLTD